MGEGPVVVKLGAPLPDLLETLSQVIDCSIHIDINGKDRISCRELELLLSAKKTALKNGTNLQLINCGSNLQLYLSSIGLKNYELELL